MDSTKKMDINEIRERLASQKGRAFWRSLDEVADTDEFRDFLAKEFPRQAAPVEGSFDRRDVLKLLGASLALGGLTSCARPPQPNETIVPYVRPPEEVVPGKPLFFATAMLRNGYAEGVLAESHMGRPTKLEGNPDHPASLGATDAIMQAQMLSLYDPERSVEASEGGALTDAAAAIDALRAAVEATGDGTGFRLLTGATTSPTFARLMSDLLAAYPNARWHRWEPGHGDGAIEGARLAFGRPLSPVYDFTAADVVVSLGADFTAEGPGRLRYARDFAARRRVREAADDMNRLYVLESIPSPTGSIADHRLRARPAEIAAFAAALAAELGVGAPEATVSGGLGEALEAVLEDLGAARGRSLVVAGEFESPAVHALAFAINEALGNVGSTVRFIEPVEVDPVPNLASISELAADMAAGDVEVLAVFGANPVYTAPADLEFAAAMENVPFTFHTGLYRDETGLLADRHVPSTHELESWDDARAFDGTATILQPLIRPFYEAARSPLQIVAALLGEPDATPYDLVRATWRARVEGPFDAFWRETVYRGVVAGTEAPAVDASVGALDLELPTDAELSVVIRPDPSIADGRWANNGWLQELPKPFTKMVWGNAALVSPATAEALGVRTEQVIELAVEGGGTVTAPVWILPGMADGVIGAHMGFGRSEVGSVADGVGFDAFDLLVTGLGTTAPVLATPGERFEQLATTQVHQSLDGTGEQRHIIRGGTLAEWREEPEHPHFVHPVEHAHSNLYPEYEYESYAWGMVVDMSVCTGCSACVVACQSENNIPIVGKEQVMVGREMHWLRIDAYYADGLDDPNFFHMPMMCQHCEKAPCEPVCPVGATVHDQEGLNVMVYNRCVGTRYCENNCPYKVRRFNYLQYAELAATATERSLAHNPDVTVRSRGVMEKCTYCVQRISGARITSNNEGRVIRDGEVRTACQAACPTQAIVFGDTNDPTSEVALTKTSPLNYALLAELNTQPRTSYLAVVRNPNPRLAGEGTEAH